MDITQSQTEELSTVQTSDKVSEGETVNDESRVEMEIFFGEESDRVRSIIERLEREFPPQDPVPLVCKVCGDERCIRTEDGIVCPNCRETFPEGVE